MDKEVRRVLKALDRRGFILEPVKSGTRVFTPDETLGTKDNQKCVNGSSP